MNFWTAGTTAPLTTTAPCSVLVRTHLDGTATPCASTPTRDVRALTVTWHRAVTGVLPKPTTVVAARTGQGLSVDFADLTGTDGDTQTVRVRL